MKIIFSVYVKNLPYFLSGFFEYADFFGQDVQIHYINPTLQFTWKNFPSSEIFFISFFDVSKFYYISMSLPFLLFFWLRHVLTI